MDTKKTTRPNSVDKAREKPKPLPKPNLSASANVKRTHSSKTADRSRTPPMKFTLIPKEPTENNKANVSPTRDVKIPSDSFERELESDELDKKLRLIEAKEKSVAEYYEKVKELNKKVIKLHTGCVLFNDPKSRKARASSSSHTRLLSSGGVTSKEKDGMNEVLSSFEKSVHQISDIWLKTALDLTNILNNIRKNPTLEPDQFQKEHSKIQLAIKQAKSLTLIKTRSVIAEAKKLLKEGVYSDLDDLIASCREDVAEQSKGTLKGKTSKDTRGVKEDKASPKTNTPFDSSNKVENSENLLNLSPENLNAELAKKNETITLLNSKIFEFQKACNEHLSENNQLQCKIAEMNEKSQWNQAFWKQMLKLKDRIKMLQQTNKQLEVEKKDLESKIQRMSLEMDKVTRLNQLFKRQLNMCREKQANAAAKEETLKSHRESDNSCLSPPSLTGPTVFQKEKIIEELTNILVLMKGQENFANQKISEFETKIEEFKKYRS